MLNTERVLMMGLIGLLIAVFSLPAFALDLGDARSQGLVGEKRDGYVAAIKNSAEVSALVTEVNAKRKAEYTRISGENGQSADVVGKLAHQQIIQGLPSGGMYQGEDGSWKKR